MFRILGSVDTLNEQMGLRLTHHDVNWCSSPRLYLSIRSISWRTLVAGFPVRDFLKPCSAGRLLFEGVDGDVVEVAIHFIIHFPIPTRVSFQGLSIAHG